MGRDRRRGTDDSHEIKAPFLRPKEGAVCIQGDLNHKPALIPLGLSPYVHDGVVGQWQVAAQLFARVVAEFVANRQMLPAEDEFHDLRHSSLKRSLLPNLL